MFLCAVIVIISCTMAEILKKCSTLCIMPERIILPKSELIYLSLISCESIKSKLSKMCRNKQRNTKPLTNI